jgi:hypothetical protein
MPTAPCASTVDDVCALGPHTDVVHRRFLLGTVGSARRF